MRTRAAATALVEAPHRPVPRAHARPLAGFDFPFGSPLGFARAVAGRDDPLALWAEPEQRVRDGDDNAQNGADVAVASNGLFPGRRPSWGSLPAGRHGGTSAKGREGHDMAERRVLEGPVPRAQPARSGRRRSWVSRVCPRRRIGDAMALAEVHPSLIDPEARHAADRAGPAGA